MVANPARVASRASWRQDGRVVRATNPVADILLVENDSDDVLFAQEALAETKRALKLHVVRDGAAAWDLLHPNGQTAEAVRPDLILSDLHMPRMDGLELLSAIKSDVKLRPIPVILMTGSYDEVDVAKALRSGANAYLVKPMLFTELCRMMQAILSFWFDVAVAPPKD